MPPLSLEKRQAIIDRVTGGQKISGPEGIATTMGVSVKTIYKLLRQFKQEDGSYLVQPARVALKTAFTREHLIELSQWLQASPKMTLHELRQKLVSEGYFRTLDDVPDASTVWRRLQSIGFEWRKPVYSDPHAKSGVIAYERCAFRAAQDIGVLDPTTLLSIDESNFFIFDQPARSWGTTARPSKLEKPKGKTMRRVMLACMGFQIGRDGVKHALIHWVLVPPRKSWRPLSDEIEQVELKPTEAADIASALTSVQHIKTLDCGALKAKLKALGIRSAHTSQQIMRETLLRVFKNKTRLGELRVRGRGRPTVGGACEPATIDARTISEYLYACLVPFLKTGKLHNPEGHECQTTADEGIESCPDGGKLEAKPNLQSMSILWDNAPPHLPTHAQNITPFGKYVTQTLGIGGGVKHTPPFSPQYAPIELFFSYVKRYVRKFAPATTEQLVQRIREATDKVDANMISGFYRKCGFLIPGEPEEQERTVDPNAGVENRCTLPKNARFEAKEHVACFDKRGKLRREKRKGARTWSKYDEMDMDNQEEGEGEAKEKDDDANDLQNLSVTGRNAVRPKKRVKIAACAPPDNGEKTRWTGIGQEPPGIPHATSTDLWHADSYYAVEGIVDERKTPEGNSEYKVRWRGYGPEHDT
jgi:transposase